MSIRRKLFLQIGSLIILLVGVLIIANTLFLEEYYTNSKKNSMIKTLETINAMEVIDEDVLDILEAKTRFDIVIGTENGEVVYSTNGKIDRLPPFGEKDQHDRPKFKVESEEAIEGGTLLWARDEMSGIRILMIQAQLENDLRLGLHFPLASIKPSIAITNQFLIIIGIVIFILSMIVAYVISRSFTQPILSMNKVTKQMKKLNFDETCEVSSNDEIGQLSESINELSHELSLTMDELNTKNKELETKVQEKRMLADKRKALLSNVSHELKTPLALIQGYAEGLELMAKDTSESIRNYSEIILDESRKMNDLIERILDVDQIESGNLIINEVAFDMSDRINYHLNALKDMIHKKSIKLSVDLSSAYVLGDDMLIDRVLINLLTNAIFHISSPFRMQVRSVRKGNKLRVSVINSSKKLGDDEIESLWDSFYKLDQARTRHTGGHGLGLSIVKAVMDAHGSDCGVYQGEEEITFWFELPCKS